MKKLNIAILLFSISATPVLSADIKPPVVDGKTFVQHEIALAKAKYSDVFSIMVEGQRKEDSTPVIFGFTNDASMVLKPSASLSERAEFNSSGNFHVVRQPYLTNTGRRVGSITVTFRNQDHRDSVLLAKTAKKIADDLAQITTNNNNGADPWPWDPAYGSNTLAQTLTERTRAQHPDVMVMMIHAFPPSRDKIVIIGSNVGRIGKLSDAIDVFKDSKTNLELNLAGDAFESEMPLDDAHGKRVGALGLTFHYTGQDKEKLHQHAVQIMSEVSRQIPNSAALFQPAR